MKLIARCFVNTQGTPQKVNTGNGQDQSLRAGVLILWPRGACLSGKSNKHRLPLIPAFPTLDSQWSHSALRSPHFLRQLRPPPRHYLPCLHTTSKITNYISVAHAYTKHPLFLSILFLLLPRPLKTQPSLASRWILTGCSPHPPTLRTNNSEHALYSEER